MDDLSEKLAELLNDPESLNRVKLMAENILGGEKQQDTPKTSSPDFNSLFGDGNFDPVQITKIVSVMSQLKNSSDDSRSRLLLALKPLLSPPRREKVDTAIKLLKLIDVIPLLKKSGIFDF